MMLAHLLTLPPQVVAPHFPCIFSFISCPVMFASEAPKGIRYPASNKFCCLVYNLRLKRRKTNELPLALGISSSWKFSLLEAH